MKAVQLTAVGNVRLAELNVPELADDQLLIRTAAAIVCTSDLNDIRSNPFNIQLPVTLGHEGAGVVAKVGNTVSNFQIGDRVATHPVHPCGHCVNCINGIAHLCSAMAHFGVNLPGTFAEYYIVRADRARHIPPALPFAVAALAEPVCVCLEALAQAQLLRGQRLLILGDGPFGILMARLARTLKLKTLAIAGHEDFRLAFARPAIAINTRNLHDSTALLKSHANDEGYDAVILAVGSGEAARQGLKLLRPKGRLVIFSAIHGSDVPIDLFAVHWHELEIRGACNDQDRFDEAMVRLSDPALALEQIITHQLPLESFPDALHLAEHGQDQALKIAITFPADAGI